MRQVDIDNQSSFTHSDPIKALSTINWTFYTVLDSPWVDIDMITTKEWHLEKNNNEREDENNSQLPVLCTMYNCKCIAKIS